MISPPFSPPSYCGAHARGARLVLLQELSFSRYLCQSQDPELLTLAEPIPGETTKNLGALAAELGIVIVASLYEQAESGERYNFLGSPERCLCRALRQQDGEQ